MHAILPGFKAALNGHPLFVHFPIVLWLTALLFEAVSQWRSSDELHRAAASLLYLGTLAGVVTVISGYYATGSVPQGPAADALELHEDLMMDSFSLAVGLCMLAFFARRRFTPRLRKLFLLGLAALAILLTLGTDRGGQMVYQYGVGVDWSKARQQEK